MDEITPIRRQYLEIKADHQDAILLFRLGDFYEAFDGDARLLARELDITLTSKPMGKDMRVPLAGVPHHSLDRHLATLISKGHRVAICEQVSTIPVKGRHGKKLIPRKVTRIVTPGTIIEPFLLDGNSNNFLCALFSDGQRSGIAFTDISTGDFFATEIPNPEVLTEISRLAPSELIISESQEAPSNREIPKFVSRLAPSEFEFDTARKTIFKHFGTRSLKPFGLENSPLAVSAAAAIIVYLREAQPETVENLTRLKCYEFRDYLVIDGQTLRSLEVLESPTGESLLSLIDQTQTALGGRLLRRWLRQPLVDLGEIYRRQEHLQWFKDNPDQRETLREILSQIKDLERLSGRAKTYFISPYEAAALGKSLELIPRIKRILQQDTGRFGQLLAQLPVCANCAALISAAVSDDLPVTKTAAVPGIIKDGYSEELDKLRGRLKAGREFLAALEKKERERTGIKSLRVGFNKVFGYYIEVTKSNLHLIPRDYHRKQTLVPAERFITIELKEHESYVLNAQDRIDELENSLFRQICFEIGKSRPDILMAGRTIAYLDVILSLAETADRFDYRRPVVNETSLLRIKNGRHPVIEKINRDNGISFVPNDAALGGNGAPQIALITGPNASGKSTYLRQIALIVLLAQIGSFVPAEEAVIGICDRIFTRIGLYDRIGSGESTFMTEMIETAEILHHTGPSSLILLDELGRGTSTTDGLAVARAVVEYLHNHPKVQTRTLFATHFHELAELSSTLPRLENWHFLIEEISGSLRFKFKIEKGVSLNSYGVYAARLAGLPNPVIRRAFELLEDREFGNQPNSEDFSMSANIQYRIGRMLRETDLDSISPVEALMKLYELKRLIKEEFNTSSDAKRLAG
ncbi:MAG: DNA mismatch repair protein MutS [Acidobacteria bacterium]|nr:DNA mismatch repair protein MutS [Acidobacteriota bacterium]